MLQVNFGAGVVCIVVLARGKPDIQRPFRSRFSSLEGGFCNDCGPGIEAKPCHCGYQSCAAASARAICHMSSML